MTVHQVEEYYIHIDTKEFNNEAIGRAKNYLENECHNFEIQEDFIVVDDLCGEGDAQTIEDEIMSQLNG